jgi:hypothetical protein
MFGIILNINAQIPTNGLVAYYPFNRNAHDESGNGNNPIAFMFTLTSDRCGFPSRAYNSGKSSYIYLTPAYFIGLNEYTYALWFRADAIPTLNRWILFYAGSPTDSIEQEFTFNSDLTLTGSSSNIGGNTAPTTVKSAPVDTGRWIHAVLTRDNTWLRIFINGTLAVDSRLDSLAPGQPADYGSDPKVSIGCLWGESNYSFVGAIDEVRIYKRALISEEVISLFNEDKCFETVYDTVHVYDTTYVTVYDSIAVTDTLIIDVLLTGVEPPDNISTIKVYPNPTKDYLFINTGENSDIVGYTIKIYSSLGVVVYETIINQPLYEINLSTWSGKGTYVLQVIDEQNAIKGVKKIILQ